MKINYLKKIKMKERNTNKLHRHKIYQAQSQVLLRGIGRNLKECWYFKSVHTQEVMNK